MQTSGTPEVPTGTRTEQTPRLCQIRHVQDMYEGVCATWFRVVTLWGMLPFLKRGPFGCQIDLKSVPFHMGIHPRDS